MVQRKRAAIDAMRSRAFRREGDERARGVARRGARDDVGERPIERVFLSSVFADHRRHGPMARSSPYSNVSRPRLSLSCLVD